MILFSNAADQGKPTRTWYLLVSYSISAGAVSVGLRPLEPCPKIIFNWSASYFYMTSVVFCGFFFRVCHGHDLDFNVIKKSKVFKNTKYIKPTIVQAKQHKVKLKFLKVSSEYFKLNKKAKI